MAISGFNLLSGFKFLMLPCAVDHFLNDHFMNSAKKHPNIERMDSSSITNKTGQVSPICISSDSSSIHTAFRLHPYIPTHEPGKEGATACTITFIDDY